MSRWNRSVCDTPAPPARPKCTTELSSVSITTATTSSSTVTPIASWPARSWLVPVSRRILLMIAEDETISMPARKRPSAALHPIAIAARRLS